MGHRFEDEAAIKQLAINYALGTDAIGAGDKAGGLAYYRQTFIPDAAVSAHSQGRGNPLAGTGPEGWADVVHGAFTNGGFRLTQHLIGTQNVIFDATDPDRARLSSYLYSTHVFPEPGRASHVVLGTYFDDVIRRDGRWWIARRELVMQTNEVHAVA